MESMKAPSTRAEFERNFHLLHHKEQLGQFHIASDLSHALEGLARLRALPNGRMDFLSVDESARLQANMMANMMNFEPETPPTPEPGEAAPGIDAGDTVGKAADRSPGKG
jgi:hypothetical protein